MGNVSYDTLSIRIEADSKQANASISRLSTNLENLDATAKKLDTGRIAEVKGLLQDIAKIDFSNVVKGLQSVVSAFKAFNSKSMGKAFGNLDNANFQTNYPTPDQNFELIGDSYTTGFQTIKQELVAVNNQLDIYTQKAEQAFGTGEKGAEEQVDIFEQLRTALEQAGFSGEQISAIFRSIKTESSVFDTAQLDTLREVMSNLGISAEEADRVIKHLKTDTEKLDKGAKKGTNGLKKLANQFKHILKYRIIRKIIQELYKALVEGIKNVIAFDQVTSDTIDKLGSKFMYVKDSIGAMFAPLIQIVEPILSELMTIMGDVGNSFAEMFASVNGQSTFVKAKDDLEAFNNEAKKTKALGIDELNVITENQGSFTTEDVALGEKENQLASSLREIIGRIKELFEKIKKIAGDFINKALPKILDLLQPIFKIVGFIFDLVSQLLDETFESVNDSLVDFLSAVKSIFGFVSTLVKSLMPIISSFINIFGTGLNLINGSISGISGLIEVIVNIIEPIAYWLEPIASVLGVILTLINAIVGGVGHLINGALNTLVSLFKAVFGTISAFFKGDWKEIENIWKNFADEFVRTWKNVGNFFIDILNNLLKKVESFVNFFVEGAGKVGEFLGFDTSNWHWTAPQIPHIQYANGGFPEDGFFFANHNELVGQFSDGRTAVANNEQITAGIYQAVRDAMRDAGGNGQDVVINLDGYELARVVTNKQKNYGADIVLGNTLSFGK